MFMTWKYLREQSLSCNKPKKRIIQVNLTALVHQKKKIWFMVWRLQISDLLNSITGIIPDRVEFDAVTPELDNLRLFSQFLSSSRRL